MWASDPWANCEEKRNSCGGGKGRLRTQGTAERVAEQEYHMSK